MPINLEMSDQRNILTNNIWSTWQQGEATASTYTKGMDLKILRGKELLTSQNKVEL